MSCYDKSVFIENSLIEELVCSVCLDVMTVPIMMSCGNGCVIGKGCHKYNMDNCPKCNEKLFIGCDGCCLDGCKGTIHDMELCDFNCNGCGGLQLYGNCKIADGGKVDVTRCHICRGCYGCYGAKNNSPIVCTLKNIVCKMMVKCKNDGCDEKFIFGKLESHKEVCLFEKVKCKYCDFRGLESVMIDHESNICKNRMVKCSQCNNIYKHIDLKEHVEEKCPETIIICDCDNKVARKNHATHVKNDCPLTIIKCKYLAVKCDYECQRSSMLVHYSDQMAFHLNLMDNKVGIV